MGVLLRGRSSPIAARNGHAGSYLLKCDPISKEGDPVNRQGESGEVLIPSSLQDTGLRGVQHVDRSGLSLSTVSKPAIPKFLFVAGA